MLKDLPIRSVSRGLAVLQCINRHGSMSQTEVARTVGLPYATTFRIIQTLVYEGMLECEPGHKQYRAAPLVQSLSVGYLDHGDLVTQARPHIVALTREIAWPLAISTHVGQHMVVRDSTHHQTSLALTHCAPGYTLPLLECASGHAYLAHVPDEDRLNMLDGLETVVGITPMLEKFRSGRLVQRIRENGYATCDRNPNTSVPGKTSSISAPIFRGDLAAGALTMVFFSSSMPMSDAVRRYAVELKEAAAAITAGLRPDA